MRARSAFKIVNGRPVLDIGRLIHPVTIWQSVPKIPPAYDAGGPLTDWTPFATGMASIDFLSGSDAIKGGQTVTQLHLELVMWFQSGILPSMHVSTENGSTYIIEAIENVLEQNVVLVVTCLALGPNE